MAPYTSEWRGWTKGQPLRYRKGHSGWTKNYGPRWIVDANGCWIWQRFINASGYGQGTLRGKFGYAHRLIYEEMVGPIPKGWHLDHLCRVPPCVNPEHLEPVTPRENAQRGAATSVFEFELPPLYERWQAGASLRSLAEPFGMKHSNLAYRLRRYATDHGLPTEPRVPPVRGQLSHQRFRGAAQL